MAVRTSFVQLSNVASTNLVFDQAIYNGLNLYDTTTGVYTVAFDAYYLIHVQIYSSHIPDFRILVSIITDHQKKCRIFPEMLALAYLTYLQ